MEKLNKLIACFLLGLLLVAPATSMAAEGVLDLHGTPMLLGLSGNSLVVGTESTENLKIMSNGSVSWNVEGADGDLVPETDNAVDIGSASAEIAALFCDGTVKTDVLAVDETSTLTGNVGFGGTMIGTGTATIGWAVVAGANTACTTTCTTPCVFGVNTAATEADIVDCADATADECLCAGAT